MNGKESLQGRVAKRVLTEVAEPLVGRLAEDTGKFLPVSGGSSYASVAEMFSGVATAVKNLGGACPSAVSPEADGSAVARSVEAWVEAACHEAFHGPGIQLATGTSPGHFYVPASPIEVTVQGPSVLSVQAAVTVAVFPLAIVAEELGDARLPQGGFAPARISFTVTVDNGGTVRQVLPPQVAWGARA